jgi:hypothetical protein
MIEIWHADLCREWRPTSHLGAGRLGPEAAAAAELLLLLKVVMCCFDPLSLGH